MTSINFEPIQNTLELFIKLCEEDKLNLDYKTKLNKIVDGYIDIFITIDIEKLYDLFFDFKCICGIEQTTEKIYTNGYTLVMFAAKTNKLYNIEKAFECTSNTVDINHRNDNGNSALMLTTDLQCIQYLISKGADVNIMDNKLLSPLVNIIIETDIIDRINIIKLLVSNGADVNSKTKKGNTPLLLINYADDDAFEIASYLIENGADINLANNAMTPLLYTSRKINKNSLKMFTYLIDKKANVNAQDSEGITPLHKLLLDPKKDVYNNETYDAIKYLIKNGANINLVDNNGWTPLNYAVNNCSKNLDMIKFLVNNGAKVDISDYQQEGIKANKIVLSYLTGCTKIHTMHLPCDECVVCMHNKPNLLYNICGHTVLCKECFVTDYTTCLTCGLCRTKNTHVYPV